MRSRQREASDGKTKVKTLKHDGDIDKCKGQMGKKTDRAEVTFKQKVQ